MFPHRTATPHKAVFSRFFQPDSRIPQIHFNQEPNEQFISNLSPSFVHQDHIVRLAPFCSARTFGNLPPGQLVSISLDPSLQHHLLFPAPSYPFSVYDPGLWTLQR
jgi:hypothetical protein